MIPIIVTSPSDIQHSQEWREVVNFKSKFRLRDSDQIIAKYERDYSLEERIRRIFEGLLRVFSSGGFALFDKGVRKLFTAATEKKHYAVRLNEEQIAILKDYGSEMVASLGGITKVSQMPKVPDHWDGSLASHWFEAEVSLGKENKIPVIVFNFMRIIPPSGENTKSPPTIDTEKWKKFPSHWQISTSDAALGHAALGHSVFSVLTDTPDELYLIERVGRLMRGEAVGRMQYIDYRRRPLRLPDRESGPNGTPPPRFQALIGHDRSRFVEGYENRPAEGKTDLFLYDPSKRVTGHSLNAMMAQFPAMQEDVIS